MHVNEMTVPVDYETICLHQRDDLELQNYRTHETTRENYKTEQFGKSILWKKGDRRTTPNLATNHTTIRLVGVVS